MKLFIFIFLIFSIAKSQFYTLADPYYLLDYELRQFNNDLKLHPTSMRPFYFGDKNRFSVIYKSEIYFNDNATNQENMDLRYIGKGFGLFKSLNVTGYNKFFAFNFEPFLLVNNYRNVDLYRREAPFTFLNDAKDNNNLKDIGLRKADFYIHYNGLGVGISNSNMWWGPGFHSALSMTNNTTGFKNFMIGTIRELKWKNFGIMSRYTFANLNDEVGWEARYFTSLTMQLTIYSEQLFTFGFSRNYLTGGEEGVNWSREDAQKIIFEGVFIKNLQKLDYTIAGHDPWDQTISAWTEIAFPKNKLKIYLELGFNDNRFNMWDFIVQPDHAMASIFGFRKYGLLNNENIVFGFEYANLIKGRHHIFRATPNWYDRSRYDDFSYDNRRWGAHSGSDSDDLTIYLGLMNQKWSFIPSFNFERHGVTTHRPSEIKTEIKLEAQYRINNFQFGLFYENQFEAHLGFPPDQYFIDEITGKRRTNTVIIKILKNIL